ncbi:BON domain-containing protein [Undibacterium sp.]|jgi:hyperosmotically inducible protein|uniref:BON domain-containing protein n=1 Tax=Undibacterium sp. TaxID=1914977 RepID=UPI002C08EA87|nr:BON domain-containing protein [Undibacterium sp.]HTD05166.1 BON domain-containing protein [Undibacterium sp.]
MITLTNRSAYTAAIGACVFLALLSGCNKNQDSVTTAPPMTVGMQVDDSVITAKVRAALMQDEQIKSLDIKVTTNKGQVMLSGFADSQAQIDRSVMAAKGVEGVVDVDNKLSLKEGQQTVGNKIDDSVITAQVKSAMLADPDMKSLDVSVTTQKGEVQLSGFVDNNKQLTHAVDVAKTVDGVASVVNHMSLKK